MSLRHQQSAEPEPAELSPGTAVVPGRLGDQVADAIDRAVLAQIAPQTLGEQVLFLREGEIHQPAPRPGTFGSRGKPRPRSLMMFF